MFQQNLYKKCLHYMEIRNLFPGISVSPSDPVFVSWAGRVMSSSLTGDQIASFLQRATAFNLVEQQSRKNTAILVIKSFVSKVHTETSVFKKKILLTWCATVTRQRQDCIFFCKKKQKTFCKPSLRYRILCVVKNNKN